MADKTSFVKNLAPHSGLYAVFLGFSGLLLSGFAFTSSSYEEIYPIEFKRTIDFYKINKSKIDSIFKYTGIKPALAFSIVAPEVGRFREHINQMEVAACELFYVELGSAYGDFSIGPFQMKPSFAEQVERSIRSTNSSAIKQLSYGSTDAKEIRRQRVARLNNADWQMIYLKSFITLVQETHRSGVTNANDVDFLRFFACAYNVGLNASSTRLIELMDVKSFPGIKFGKNQYAYSMVAVEYYKTLTSQK